MIIVSQDKDVIVNFDIITKLWIQNPLENDDGEFTIIAENEWISERLGYYKTEERAKEVLQEIIKEYRLTEITKATINRLSDDVGALAIKEVFVYEMPEG